MKKSMGVSFLATIVSLLLVGPAVALAEMIDRGEIVFEAGASSATLSGAVVRGDSDAYSLVCAAGQWIGVSIDSPEDNAVFDLSVYSYGTGRNVLLQGAKDGQDARDWQGHLPSPGYSKDGSENVVTIRVGATRGNASYRLSVETRGQATDSAQAGATSGAPPPQSVNGKYRGLIQTLHCPRDHSQYGEFTDYGYWQGGAWCGQTGKAGYWVWVPPNWYVWAEKTAP
jgi:hypothetical protein